MNSQPKEVRKFRLSITCYFVEAKEIIREISKLKKNSQAAKKKELELSDEIIFMKCELQEFIDEYPEYETQLREIYDRTIEKLNDFKEELGVN